MKYPKVISVKPLAEYRLYVEWEDGKKGTFDCKPYLIGDWYGELLDNEKFFAVRPCGKTIEWENGQDIAPHELYDYAISE